MGSKEDTEEGLGVGLVEDGRTALTTWARVETLTQHRRYSRGQVRGHHFQRGNHSNFTLCLNQGEELRIIFELKTKYSKSRRRTSVEALESETPTTMKLRNKTALCIVLDIFWACSLRSSQLYIETQN